MGEIIAYSGTHGTGKTTSAAMLFTDMKLLYPNKSIYLLADQERRYPYPDNPTTVGKKQLWIFRRLIEEEQDLLEHFDLIITDHTIMDVVAYTQAMGMDELAAAMWDLAAYRMTFYKQIRFRRIALHDHWHDDGHRETTDKEFRIEVETLLEEYYSQLTIGRHITGEFTYA